jgi:Na+/phosphate symporter
MPIVIAIVPALVAIVGALIYLIASNPKLAEVGRLAFLAGMIALCIALASHVVHLG